MTASIGDRAMDSCVSRRVTPDDGAREKPEPHYGRTFVALELTSREPQVVNVTEDARVFVIVQSDLP